jgi:hypothetical protein
MIKTKIAPAESMTKNELGDALIEIHGEGDAAKPTAEENKKRKTKTDRLIKLVLAEAYLFHDADMKAYATIQRDGHRETYPLRSKSFRTWVSGRLWKESQEGCGGQVIQDALGTIEAHAVHDGNCHPVHVRLAESKGKIYLDLGSDRFDVVEIGPDDWRVLVDQNVVKFRRPSGMAALPYPKEGGSIERLKRYINLANPEDWTLIVGFILGCFHPSGPYPTLAVTGEQGTAKSTLLKAIKAVTDPSTAPLRSAPKELRDLAISANNSWILAFDNLSDLPSWLSDGLCRLATGGGFATRTLYSDDEETIFDAKRPVMLNCIANIIRRHDLVDRAIIVNLAAIPKDNRIPENDFWTDFEDDAPEILGAILDAVSCALRDIDTVNLVSYPRMADFAKWVTAAEPALGWTPGTFMEAYKKNIHEVTSLALDADLVGSAVIDFMQGKTAWEGTATDILDALEFAADDRTKWAKGWPKAAHSLSGKLTLSATALRTHGIEVTFLPRSGKQKLIRLEQVGEQSVTSVIDRENSSQDIDIKDKSPMSLSSDRSVTNPQNKTADISANYKINDARDGNDASIPPSFRTDDLREVLL